MQIINENRIEEVDIGLLTQRLHVHAVSVVRQANDTRPGPGLLRGQLVKVVIITNLQQKQKSA